MRGRWGPAWLPDACRVCGGCKNAVIHNIAWKLKIKAWHEYVPQ